MFGYIAPLKSELKIREFEVYNAYYCAICHAVKRRYGETPRLTLTYDAVFIALLAAGLTGGPAELSYKAFRCFNNPAKKRNEVMPSASVDYAADVMVLLAWLSLKDGKEDRDQGSFFKDAMTAAGEAVMRRFGRRAAVSLGGKADVCCECAEEQQSIEAAGTDSIDRAADPTGRLMAELLDFTDAPDLKWRLAGAPLPELSQALRGLGYHLGRYIYIIDAVDDLEKDRKTGAYNPLLLKPETPEALKTVISLDLARLGELAGLLPLACHNSIIDNIVYLGLHARTDEVLAGVKGGPAV